MNVLLEHVQCHRDWLITRDCTKFSGFFDIDVEQWRDHSYFKVLYFKIKSSVKVIFRFSSIKENTRLKYLKVLEVLKI